MHAVLAVYDSASGKIKRIVECDDDMIDMQANDDEGVLQVRISGAVQDDTHYVKNGGIREKSVFDTMINVSGFSATVTGVPAGTTVTVGGASVVADVNPVEIEFDIPGTYTIDIGGLVEYRDESMEVTVG